MISRGFLICKDKKNLNRSQKKKSMALLREGLQQLPRSEGRARSNSPDASVRTDPDAMIRTSPDASVRTGPNKKLFWKA